MQKNIRKLLKNDEKYHIFFNFGNFFGNSRKKSGNGNFRGREFSGISRTGIPVRNPNYMLLLEKKGKTFISDKNETNQKVLRGFF